MFICPVLHSSGKGSFHKFQLRCSFYQFLSFCTVVVSTISRSQATNFAATSNHKFDIETTLWCQCVINQDHPNAGVCDKTKPQIYQTNLPLAFSLSVIFDLLTRMANHKEVSLFTIPMEKVEVQNIMYKYLHQALKNHYFSWSVLCLGTKSSIWDHHRILQIQSNFFAVEH